MSPLLRTLAAAASLGAAAAGGSTVYGVFHSADSINSCNLVSLDVSTGVNATLADVSAACVGLQVTWPAYTAPAGDSSSFLLAAATGASIYSIATPSGAVKAIAPLSAYNDSDPLIGMVTLSPVAGRPSPANGTYVVYSSGIMKLVNGALRPFARLSLPQQALVTVGPWGGAANCGQLFIADKSSDAMIIIDLGTNGIVGTPVTVHTKVQKPMDFQFTVASGTLVMLADYVWYAVLTDGSEAPAVGPYPNGPGFPSTNGMSPDGLTWFIIDFANLRTIRMDTGIISSPLPFNGAPRAVGFPVWL